MRGDQTTFGLVKISKNILMYQTIGIIKLKNTGTGVLLHI